MLQKDRKKREERGFQRACFVSKNDVFIIGCEDELFSRLIEEPQRDRRLLARQKDPLERECRSLLGPKGSAALAAPARFQSPGSVSRQRLTEGLVLEPAEGADEIEQPPLARS